MPIYKMNGKKDGLQKYRVRINYTDASGTARQIDRVAYGSQAAKDLERQLNTDLRSEPSNRITVSALYDEYVRSQKNEIRETSLDKTRQMLDKFVIPDFGETRLSKLSLAALQAWKNKISEMTKQDGTEYSISYKNNIYTMFRALLNYAVKLEYIPSNPLVKLGGFRDSSIEKKEMKYYTSEEFKKFIHAAKAIAEKKEKDSGSLYEWNFYIFFMIAFYTGMRKGEIYALKWSDIYDNIIHITRSIAQKLKGSDRETAPKNKSSIRNIQVPKPLADSLSEHYDRCKAIDGFSRDWRICGGSICIRDTSLDKHNSAYASAAGLETIRIHDYRHSHASVLVNNGINIKEIARRLGHSNVDITWRTYAHLYPQEEERAIQILNKIV